MVVAVVQARMKSSRLPGKVMMEANGQPILMHLLRRLKRAKRLDKIVVATGHGPENDPIRTVANAMGVECPDIAVDEDNVLGRYLAVAAMYDAEVIVRITGDCPLVDPEIVDTLVERLGGHELSTNVLHRTYAKGMDVEVLTRECLEKIDRLCKDDRREHVTLYIYRNAHLFDIYSHSYIANDCEIIVCVDYPEDLVRVKAVLEWNADATYPEILRFMKEWHESEADRILTLDGSSARRNR